MRFLGLFIGIVVGVAAHGQSQEYRLRDSKNDSLGKIASASTLEQLRVEFKAAPNDFPHRAVCPAQYYRLAGPNAESLLLKSLPTDGKQMKQLYEARDTREGQDRAVTKAYSTFYEASADAAAKQPSYRRSS